MPRAKQWFNEVTYHSNEPANHSSCCITRQQWLGHCPTLGARFVYIEHASPTMFWGVLPRVCVSVRALTCVAVVLRRGNCSHGRSIFRHDARHCSLHESWCQSSAAHVYGAAKSCRYRRTSMEFLRSQGTYPSIRRLFYMGVDQINEPYRC
jgi:hypothetical protein